MMWKLMSFTFWKFLVIFFFLPLTITSPKFSHFTRFIRQLLHLSFYFLHLLIFRSFPGLSVLYRSVFSSSLILYWALLHLLSSLGLPISNIFYLKNFLILFQISLVFYHTVLFSTSLYILNIHIVCILQFQSNRQLSLDCYCSLIFVPILAYFLGISWLLIVSKHSLEFYLWNSWRSSFKVCSDRTFVFAFNQFLWVLPIRAHF